MINPFPGVAVTPVGGPGTVWAITGAARQPTRRSTMAIANTDLVAASALGAVEFMVSPP